MTAVPVPTGVRCIYEKPKNLALGKPAKQSSVYGGLDAYLGVDGNTNGSDARYCVSTQQDPQAWWEVDLGDFAVLERIRVFNRVDEPPDVSSRSFSVMTASCSRFLARRDMAMACSAVFHSASSAAACARSTAVRSSSSFALALRRSSLPAGT